MRRAGRMSDQRLRITEIVRNIDDLQRVHQPERRLAAARRIEGDDRAARAHLAHGEIMLRMVLAARIAHAGHRAVIGQKIRDLHRVLAHARNAQLQRLQPFQQHPGIERTHGRPGMTQELVQMIVEELLVAERSRRRGTGLARRYAWSRNRRRHRRRVPAASAAAASRTHCRPRPARPPRAPTLETARISMMSSVGLAGDSRNTTLVSGLIAAFQASRSLPVTKLTVMPKRGSTSSRI